MFAQPRFTNYSKGVVFEPARDLHWTSNDITEDRAPHEEAIAAIAKLNEQAFGGFSDWRLPEVEELFLLADRTHYKPAIDTEFFPTCKAERYWTATDDASEDEHPSEYAWVVGFGGGGSDLCGRNGYYRVRAVRGPARQ